LEIVKLRNLLLFVTSGGFEWSKKEAKETEMEAEGD
jgi:hypothetical protein